jgi:DNA-directed RNA polymerase subunit RPC12/RpoP
MTIYNFVRNKTRKLGNLGTRLGTRFVTRKNRNTYKQSLAPSPKTQLITQIQQSYRKKLKQQLDIANFPKKRATRKIMSAYRTASANPNLEECPICLGPMLNPAATTTLYHCKHVFHTSCIKGWAIPKFHPRCPVCRTRILYYENPTVVRPTLNQQAFMRKLKAVQEQAVQDVTKIDEANSIIRESRRALKKRRALDGSNARMSRKEMENLKQQIDQANETINVHSIYDYSAFARRLENELIQNRIKEREKAEDEDEKEREWERHRTLRRQARLQNGGGGHCLECSHH